MKNLILAFLIVFLGTMCSCSSEKLSEEEEIELEEVIKSDEAKLDSMRKALENKYKDTENE
jgi:hypothetical protein